MRCPLPVASKRHQRDWTGPKTPNRLSRFLDEMPKLTKEHESAALVLLPNFPMEVLLEEDEDGGVALEDAADEQPADSSLETTIVHGPTPRKIASKRSKDSLHIAGETNHLTLSKKYPIVPRDLSTDPRLIRISETEKERKTKRLHGALGLRTLAAEQHAVVEWRSPDLIYGSTKLAAVTEEAHRAIMECTNCLVPAGLSVYHMPSILESPSHAPTERRDW